MELLIQHGLWPLAAVIIAIFGISMFRGPLAALVNRTKKIGAGSGAIDFAEATTPERQKNIQAQSESASPSSETQYALGPPTPTIADLEKQIADRLSTFNDGDDGKIKRLIRAFAITELHKEFEIVYRIIFGSQIDLLLAANAGGVDDAAALAILENARSLYPNIHPQSTSLEPWLSYPLQAALIQRIDQRIFTTQRGKEFMQYLVDVGLTNPKNNG